MSLRRFGITIFLGLSTIAIGCRPPDETPRPAVLLVAIDGLEWTVLRPLIEAGELPLFAELTDDGALGAVETLEPTHSPIIWTSIATSRRPADHGITGFVHRESGQVRPFTSRDRTAKAFWNILSEHERTVHTIGWWASYPAEEVRGTVVSQVNTIGAGGRPQRGMWKGRVIPGLPRQVYPRGYQDRVLSLLEEVEASLDDELQTIFGVFPHALGPLEERLWEQSRWSLRADLTYLRVARDLLRRQEPFDLAAVYLGGVDVLSHRFWRYAYPDRFDHPPPRQQVENFGSVLADYLRFLDGQIEQLRQLVPPTTHVVVVSDHGMVAINRDGDFPVDGAPSATNSAHHRQAPPGMLLASGPYIDPSAGARGLPASLPVLGGVYDILPTLLAFLELPPAQDFEGEVMWKLLGSTVRDSRVPGRIASYEDDGGRSALKSAPGRPEERESRERIEQLKALGYLE